MTIQKLPGSAITPGTITVVQLESSVATTVQTGGGPKLTNIQITNNAYTIIDDTAVGVTGGYIKITGTGFVTGCSVIIGTVVATSVSFISSTEVRAQVPAQSAGTYTVYLVNPDGGVGIRVNGLNYSSTPTWSTTSPLPGGAKDTAISIQLVATSNSAVTFSLQAGSTLPAGLTLSSGGLLSGTVTGISIETTYNFTIVATDAENQDTPQAFQITIVVGDPYYRLVTLHLPGTGINLAQNNTFLDGSTNNFPITRNGNTTQGTFSPFSQTGWGNYFDGSGDYLSVANNAAFNLSTNAFCVETWFYPTVSTGQIVTWSVSATGIEINLSSGTVTLELGSGSTWFIPAVNCGTAVLNAWNHIAIVKNSSGNIGAFLNGNRNYSTTNTTAIGNANTFVSIGAYRGASNYFTGYFSNFRYVNGSSVYDPTQTTITVPTAPLTAITNTALLTCQSNRFIDNSTNNFTITRNGDTRVVAFSPFNPTSSWSATTNGGSGYFDGSGDYLQSTITALTGTFTVEFWFYRSVSGNNYMFTIGDSKTTGSMEVYIGGGSTTLNYYTNDTFAISGTPPPVGAWAYIAVTRDSSNDVRLYLNGSQVGSAYNQTGTFSTALRVAAEYYNSLVNQYGTGYISNFRVSNVVRTVTSIPSSPFASDANTIILLNFTNAGIYDATSKNDLETVGNAQISTTQSKWGGSSMLFDGTGDYLQLPDSELLEFGSADFTIEAWVYLTLLTGENRIILGHGENGNSWMAFYINDSGYLVFVSIPSVTAIVNRTATSRAVSLNTWTHVAASRNGSTFRLFIDGSEPTYSGSPSSTSSALPNFAAPFRIGAQRWNGDSGIFQGYIQDLRITRGYARYTANFTPPTGAHRLK